MEESKQPQQSPTVTEKEPVDPNAMSFPDAMRIVADGGAVTKLEWKDSQVVVQLMNEKLMIRLDGVFHPLTVSYGDMAGVDWVECEPYK